jgi:hypothetical protein
MLEERSDVSLDVMACLRDVERLVTWHNLVCTYIACERVRNIRPELSVRIGGGGDYSKVPCLFAGGELKKDAIGTQDAHVDVALNAEIGPVSI